MKRVMIWLVMAAAACGGSDPNQGEQDQPDASSERVDSGPSTCSSTEECGNGKICDPTSHACVDSLACTKSADCGQAAYCAAGGACAAASTGTPCDSNTNCIGGETCQAGGLCGCGGERYQAQSVPPNILVLLDRSSSMDELTGAKGSPSKWTAAKDAVKTMLTTYNSQVRFGLALYPGTNPDCSSGASCTAGAVFVDVAASAGTSINTALTGAKTCTGRGFGTPTGEAVAALNTYDGLEDTGRANYLVLITDGGHTSSCADPTPKVTSLRGEKPEIKTFVIGFGGGVDPAELNSLATAGGTARAGTTKYYVAGDADALAVAFKEIVGSVVACTYKLSDVPPDLQQLYVYEGTKLIAHDASTGWDYDAAGNQVVLHGASCESLRKPGAGALTVVYGCPLAVD